MVIVHLKNAPVLDKKKSVVTLIGYRAKSSQRHRMWGMNVNSSDDCGINDWTAGIAPAQRAQLLGDLIDEVDRLQVIGR